MGWSLKRRSASADEFIESYVCWREACDDVRTAYRRWTTCNQSERALGFAAYRAALDREEHASSIHSAWARGLNVSPLRG
jgi:hypothetical protein